MVFSLADEIIAGKGETITSQHIALVQKVVKQRLDEVESEMKEQFQRDLEQINFANEKIKAEAEEQMEALRNQLEDFSEETKSQNSALREELRDLRPFTFLTESRYRELKSRWGQVFRADMGAEAFYDILRRLDLDQISEELWHEVRTSKSKQKRKKANQSFESC